MLKGRKKLSNAHISDLGEIPVYSSTTENNGIAGYTEEKPDYIVNVGTPFYIIFGDHTKSMYIATSDFCVMDNVKVLIPKVYNKYALQFIFTILGKAIPNLGYARHWNITQKTIIKLPVTQSGKPDWLYMEQYMKNIELRVKNQLNNLEKTFQ